MPTPNRHNEKGIALVLSILALLLLSAIAVGMMYMSTTEASVNANFKAEETEYFAARAGAEEIRDRMLPANPNTINAYAPNGAGVDTCTGTCLLPTSLPNNAGIGAGPPVLYILQSGVTMANVTTGNPATNPLYDDEFCHDFPGYGGMSATTAPNVRCPVPLPGGNWYSTPAAPGAGSPFLSAAPYPLDWKWVRITQKGNSSAIYPVNGVPGAPLTFELVCWNGTSEVTAPAGTLVFPQNNSPCGSLNPYANPVYLVTSLAVSPNGARRVVQQELAQTPANQPAGLFATSNGCAALKLSGGASTFSFNSATEPGGPTNPPSNVTASGGDVGANGNVDVAGAGTTVNGTTYTNENTTLGPCNSNNGVSGNGNPGTIANIPTYPTAYVPPVPPVPNPMPPTGNWSANGLTLAPGAYADVKITGGATTLPGGTPASPAVYTFNSLSISGGGQLVVNGPVIINIAYQGNGSAITMTSANSFVNSSGIASYLTINYCCSGSINLAGGTAAYAVVNAPNANIGFTGGSNFYGQAVGATIDDSGSATSFYWDKSANISPVTSPYYEISMRELNY